MSIMILLHIYNMNSNFKRIITTISNVQLGWRDLIKWMRQSLAKQALGC